ncbi:hypothetical protein [Bacillus thuringiensis]|uniref:hypothetical protein n=1 Tax=Bacillus thuringiensis TaxID=1428 RepID=UPI0026E1B8DC|nr:hypothetical protein [Bacillus thuringiensis]MDO6633376.1 hypothetical protein [Bacillus thuringiensis]MDO6663534.1 hypothetical protein [Bacillus thuringiensis]MDO6703563.1 hypothetical protein [Bacillus thuringiensis]
MNFKKIAGTSILLVSLLFSSTSFAATEKSPNSKPIKTTAACYDQHNLKLTQENLSFDQSEKTQEFAPINQEKLLQETGWEKPTPNAQIEKVIRVSSIEDVQNSSKAPLADWDWLVVKNGMERDGCGLVVRARTSGTGDPASGKLILEQSVKVSNSYSSNVSVSAKVVSAGVEYNVGAEFNRTAKREVDTAGQNYQIVAYDDFRIQPFDVYFTKLFKGTGTAYRQVGFCFVVWKL